jgi:DNA-binding NarL/FixJ family response regulator
VVLRVVVIDDSRLVREAVAALVRRAGHEVVGQAEDGRRGVEETLALEPDVVIVDWRMPGLDGVETTRRIRAAVPRAAVIAYCSADSAEIRDAFHLAGARSVVDKRDPRGLVRVLRAISDPRTPVG